VKLVDDLVRRPVPTEGFRTLVEAGMWDLTFEYLTLKYPQLFSESSRELARRRLNKAGVPFLKP
jgi:hypothetical protein